jgi:hypothetical protein
MSLSVLTSPVMVPSYGPGAVATSYAVLLPPGSRVAAYVRSSGWQEHDTCKASQVVTTLAAALTMVRSGLGDVIVVLPGHTETVSTATMMANLRAGTRILGMGQGSMMPTFNWSATTSKWTIAVADVVIAGCRLNVDGADGVVDAIDVTAAGFHLIGCILRVASGAALKATTALSFGAAAHRYRVAGCKVEGTATHNVTNVVLVDGACDGGEIVDCTMIASATAAAGLIAVTAAATGWLFRDLLLYNTHTSSTATIALADVACDGLMVRIKSATKNNGGAKTTQGITWGTAALAQAHDCTCSDARADSGVTSPAAAAA